MIKFKCFNCDSRIMARDRAAGTRIKCPNCGTRVIVPESKSSPSMDSTTVMKSSGASSTRNPIRSSNESSNAIDRQKRLKRKSSSSSKRKKSSSVEGLPSASASKGDTAEWRKNANESGMPLSLDSGTSEDSEKLDLSDISEDTLLPLDVGKVDKKLLANLEELFEAGILKEAEYVKMRDKILHRN